MRLRNEVRLRCRAGERSDARKRKLPRLQRQRPGVGQCRNPQAIGNRGNAGAGGSSCSGYRDAGCRASARRGACFGCGARRASLKACQSGSRNATVFPCTCAHCRRCGSSDGGSNPGTCPGRSECAQATTAEFLAYFGRGSARGCGHRCGLSGKPFRRAGRRRPLPKTQIRSGGREVPGLRQADLPEMHGAIRLRVLRLLPSTG